MDVAISSSSDRSIIQNLDHSLSLDREENFSKRIKKKEKVTDERMPLGRWNSLYIIKILTPVFFCFITKILPLLLQFGPSKSHKNAIF